MFSEDNKRRFELFFTYLGISLFVIHFMVIQCIQLGYINAGLLPSNLFGNPFSSLFTPFSVLLVYEVYLLIYYLRKSYSKSVSKQIEIMALILLRNSFKDIGKLMQGHTPFLESDLFKDLTGFVLLLILLWAFYHFSLNRNGFSYTLSESFIKLKLRMSVALFWIFIALSIFSMSEWFYSLINYQNVSDIKDPSHIFYAEFFTLLTFIDVILLLSSASNLSNTILVIRNSGYVLATLLMRISFSLTGWERIMAVIFGAAVAVFMLWISERSAFHQRST